MALLTAAAAGHGGPVRALATDVAFLATLVASDGRRTLVAAKATLSRTEVIGTGRVSVEGLVAIGVGAKGVMITSREVCSRRGGTPILGSRSTARNIVPAGVDVVRVTPVSHPEIGAEEPGIVTLSSL